MDAVFVNVQEIPPELVEKYQEKGAEPVRLDLETIREKGYTIIEGRILKTDGQVRHDSEKLARLVFDHYLNTTGAVKG